MTEATREDFLRARSSIVHALKAYTQTAYGRGVVDESISCDDLGYEDFQRIPPVSSDRLPGDDLSDFFLGRGPVEEFRTTGTRGIPRSIYWPEGSAADVDSLVRRIPEGAKVAAVFASAVVDSDVFLRAHIEGFRVAAADVSVLSFSSQKDVARIMATHNFIIIFDYPSALARFIRLIEQALESGMLSPAEVRGRTLLARLTGEPMRPAELDHWIAYGASLGCEVHIELRYGCTEFLGVGKSDWPTDSRGVEYHLTGQSCFAEALDPITLRPVYAGTGLLCATAFRTSGTILFRYLLGDQVTIFEREGRRFVRDISRPDILIVAGNTVSLSDIVYPARQSTGLELCLDIKKTIDDGSGVQTVEATVYVPTVNKSEMDSARQIVTDLLHDGLKMGPRIDHGFVDLTVDVAPLENADARRRKAWRLIT